MRWIYIWTLILLNRFSIESVNLIRSVYVKSCLLPAIFQRQTSAFPIRICKFWKKVWILFSIRRPPFVSIKVSKKRSIWIRWAVNDFGICARKWEICGVLYMFRPHTRIQLDPMLMSKCTRQKLKWIWIHSLNVPMFYRKIWSIRLQLIYKYVTCSAFASFRWVELLQISFDILGRSSEYIHHYKVNGWANDNTVSP